MNEHNPYSAPPNVESPDSDLPFGMDPADKKKVDAVIKDAGQFWLAIILCILCSAIGALIIPFWYLARLVQWNGLAKKYPSLMAEGAPAGSLQARFKSSQWKLIVGMAVGAVILLGIIAYVFLIGLMATAGAA